MGNFKETFSNKHTVLPVVHVENPTQAIRNTQVAIDTGCDGVFLIDMKADAKYEELLEIHSNVRKEFPDFWLGVNFLDLETEDVFDKLNSGIDGVWVDNAKINSTLSEQDDANVILQKRKNSGWEGLYFGGVAFKYQEESTNPAKDAEIACDFMDVVTTSGIGTASAPDVKKISSMKNAIGDFPLAIASGISPENVKKFLPITDCFLTASSLLIPKTQNFDKRRVSAFVDTIRNT